MKRLLLLSVLMMSLFILSCDKSTDPEVDVDEITDGTGVTDTDTTETEDKTDDQVDENQQDDVVNDESEDNEVNDETTDEAQPECTKDEMKCEGTVLTWCKDGFWTTVKDCADEDKICEVVDDTPQCVEEEEKCTPEELKCSGTKILKCNAEGEWVDEQDCADNSKICEDNEGVVTCEDIVVKVCEDGETKCSGDVILNCNVDGQWENGENCATSDKICVFESDTATCQVPPCTPDDMKCVGTEVQKCNSSEVWAVEIDCNNESKICRDNGTTVECIVPPVCTAGQTQCNGNTVELCNTEGQWESFTNCESNDKVCVFESSSASCQTPPCVENDKECDGKAVLTCNAGGTWDSVDCPGIQVCNDDGTTVECVDPPECAEGEKKCFGNTLMTCSAALEWDTPLNCEDTDEFCDESGAEAKCMCTPTEMKCDGTELKLCDGDGLWQTQVDCNDTGKICSDNGITVECKIPPVCTPGEKQCNGNTIEICDTEGQWETSVTCDGATPTCLEMTDVPTCVCQNDDLRCTGVVLEKCTSGMWGQEEDCSDTAKECREITGTPQCAVPLCTPDDKSCSGETLLQCDSEGAWQTSDVCSDHGELCREKDGTSQCVCTPDALQCGERTEGNHEDYIVYKCDTNYDWVEETDCLTADDQNPQACDAGACIDITCGDSVWHDMVEWCDSTDPAWQAVNSGDQDVACADFWTPESGIGGTGLISCLSNCRVELLNCEPTGTPYGTITTVNGNIQHTIDYSRRADNAYMDGLPNEAFIFPDPVFAGTLDGTALPPETAQSGWASASQSIAFHVDGTTSSFIVLMQSSLEINLANQDEYNWFDISVQYVFEDTKQTGTYAVNIYSGDGIDVYDVDPAITTEDKTCLKAIGFLGSVTFNSVSNLTNSDGGSFELGGGPVYLYHPSDIPIYGDITDQVEEVWGVPACPQ